MNNLLKRVPWFYILFTIFPLLFLWVKNVSEIYASDVIRPFVFTLAGSGILYAILYAIFRNTWKAALIGSLLLLAFFSYGQLYYEARVTPALRLFSHHSILMPIYAIILGIGIWVLSFRLKKYDGVSRYLNWVSLALVVIQVAQLGYATIAAYSRARQPLELQAGLAIKADTKDLPDVYFIVLDGYMRADAMKQDLGFDNTAFIHELEEMGFYVARCSRPNYDVTRAAIASTLNMSYISNMPDVSTVEVSSFYNIIKNNQVRHQLESAGYKTVAFETDFPWLNFDNADIYFNRNHSVTDFGELYPFEVTYMNSTALSALNAAVSKLGIRSILAARQSGRNTGESNLPLLNSLQHHANVQLFILDKLLQVPQIPGPKFVYAHLIVPHYPYVFGPDGEILTDPGFTAGGGSTAINADYARRGYLDGIQFINGRIVPILQAILHESKIPPIIVLEGDHGQSNENKYTSLNAYYLPKGYQNLYETITPVNSFRIILDEYLGGNYPVLADHTHINDVATVPETYADCMP